MDFEYVRALNIPGFWYTRVPNIFLILNMLGYWIYHGSKYARVTQGFEYAWIIPVACICLIMPQCAKICLNGFCFTFTHCNSLSKGTIDCFLGKKLEVFDFVYCFRLNIFTVKISNLLLPLGDWGSRVPWTLRNQWYNQ